MQVLVDSSVWIDYFRGGGNSDALDTLIDANIISTNDLILAELIPYLQIKGQDRLIDLLGMVHRLELRIVWEQIIRLQYDLLKNGINGIGIPDLIMAQNAIQHGCKIYALDRHFTLMSTVLGIELLELQAP
ncbi:MAG: PIN domain-containing protein [Candidatus Fermentibacteraceae bacterium]